jgi:ATP-dependent Clp protease protease subunit
MIINNHNHKEERAPVMLRGYAETYIRLAKDRMIFLSEDVTKESAAELSALLLYYDNEDNDLPISLYINSDGGDANGLANIYDVMQIINAPIKTICLGKAYSAAAVLLSAGMPGERYALKNSEVMIHGIQCAFPIPGHDQIDSKKYLEYLLKHNDSIMSILAKHTGHTLEKVKEDCSQDLWLSAKQALEYGIIDHIL